MSARMFEEDSGEEIGSDSAEEFDEDDEEISGNDGDSDEENDVDSDTVAEVKDETEKKSKKKTKKKSTLDKLLNDNAQGVVKLTMKEITNLKETQDLYNSNLYRFQIQELLSEVTVSTKRKLQVEKWCEELTSYVDNLPKSERFSLGEFKNWMGSGKLPLPEKIHPAKLAKGSFQWSKPNSIKIVGSYSLDVALNKMSTVDIVVEMPKEFLYEHDYLNHRYYVKRAMYLTYLAMQLTSRGDKVTFTTESGNYLKPLIKVTEKHFTVLLYAVPPSNYFKMSRFNPLTNNLRYEHFTGNPMSSDVPEFNTPHYNASIVSDCLAQKEHQLVKRILEKSTNIKDALKMLKVWLTQRTLTKGYGAFTGHIVTMFVCFLASKSKINGMMSSYQIIRIVFNNLANMDLTTTGISFNCESVVSDWNLNFEVVFLDESGHMNYTANMSKLTYKRIQLEAKRALAILDGAQVSGFQAMFITKLPFALNFDHILQLRKLDILMSAFKKKERWSQLFLDYSDYFHPIAISLVGDVLEKALGNRVQLIDVELLDCKEWDVSESPPNSPSDSDCLRFGIVINREAAFRIVEKCESEDSAVVTQFKDFWEDKLELRRFKDGTMLETVTFDDPQLQSRVCFQMVKYALEKHLGIKLKNGELNYLDEQLEKSIETGYLKIVLKRKKREKSDNESRKPKRLRIADLEDEHVHVTLDEIMNSASKSFDELSKTLRQLEGLPLAITSVQGTSSVLRFTSVYPTPPQRFYSSTLLTHVRPNSQSLLVKTSKESQITKCPKHVEPIGVMVHLESSGKWPDDIQAIERLKCAFLLRIGELLKDQFGLTTQVYPRHVDVMKDGFIFRIRLTYFREIILLKQFQGSDGILKIRDNPETLLLERETLVLPQLTSTLHAFHQHYEAYGKTCRLAKRWVASQLLLASPVQFDKNFDVPDCRFTEVCIELLVAQLFLYFAPHLSPPNEAQTGFLRFLFLLSSNDWKAMPVILNFNESLSQDEVSKIESIFSRKRETFPALFISTPEDKFGSVWTKNLHPIVIQRASALAAQALSIISEDLCQFKIANAVELDSRFKAIFRPTTTQFDVIIWIKREMDPRKTQTIDFSTENILKFKQYIKDSDELIPIVDFDPVQQYLKELRDTFGHLAIFLHDMFGGNFIAVVWKPDALLPQSFKVSGVNGKEVFDDAEVVGNVLGVLEGFEILGTGIVDRIETKE